MYDYDLIIIGGGPAGLSAAETARRLRLKCLLVEKSRLGGCDAWSGSVPSKALRHLADTARASRSAALCGMDPPTGNADMPHIQQYVRNASERIAARDSIQQLAAMGTQCSMGHATIIDGHTVAIDGEHHTSKAIVIATGSRPHIPAIPGLQHTPYLTTEDIWGLEELPRSMAIIGAGYAACEMGQLLALLGVHVTILNRSARVLSQGDADVSELVGRRLAQDGVEILNNCAINAVSEAGQAIRIDRGDSSIEADCLLVATGRQPEISHLGLEDVGVVHTAKGISVDGIQRTSVGTIFAAGDCTGGSMSAIHARKEGAAAVLAATNHHVEPVAGVHIPRVLYTIPEVAQAGMTEAGARAVHGDRINVYCKSLHELDRALIDVQDEGIMKIVCLRNGGILGITIISPCAGELIGSWCEALRSSEHLKHIAETPYAYPSYLQASVEAAKDLLEESGQPLSKPSLLDMLRKLNK